MITAPGDVSVLRLEDRPAPEPGSREIRVRVRASALNRADLLQRQGHYPAPAGAPPDIPGLEYAGEVEARGPGAHRWAVGDRVMGIVAGGAHAERLCVHEDEAIAIPAPLDDTHAAAIPEAFLTAYDALVHRVRIARGEMVLVHAVASGVGTAALQLAHHLGASVIGTSRSAPKLARARELGLVHAVDASRGEWPEAVEAIAGRAAVPAVVDLVGAAYLAGNLRVMAPLGRMVVVGLTAGSRAPIDLGVVLAKRLTIVGTVLRSRSREEKAALAREFATAVMPAFASGTLRPVVDRVMSFYDIRAAHELLASNETFGKVVLRWD